jgi:D-alanine-D-alanine ligase-like ATP-grasp enzyme
VTKRATRKPVHVLFGGQTSERQVSLMSGTNVWLKLRRSEKYEPHPFLWDLRGNVWRLPYALTLNHTVEEITANCQRAAADEKRLHALVSKVKTALALEPDEVSEPFFLPEKMTLSQFIRQSPFVFIGLHGGAGEDGTIQNLLTKARVPFNGSGPAASKLCMDKWATNERIRKLAITGITTIPERSVAPVDLLRLSSKELQQYWSELRSELGAKTIIAKPRADGCSSGVVRLSSAAELRLYAQLAQKNPGFIPERSFAHQQGIIEMPLHPIHHVLLGAFIETDTLRVKGNQLKHVRKTDWLEVTVGVTGPAKHLQSMSPSITVAEGAVLSVEEKFQGGTGINITPPPQPVVSPSATTRVHGLITKLANAIGLSGYARIDCFMHRKTGELMVIEINTLPGLTGSTVLFHQALAEKPPVYPREFVERIILNTGY